MVFCNHQGQMDMKSEFETRLYQDLSDQILAEIKDSKELCFVWMFLRSRGPSGNDKNGLPLKIIKTVSIDFKQATVKHYNLYHHKPPKVLPKKYWNRLMKMIMIMLYRRLLLARKRIHMKATTKMILSSWSRRFMKSSRTPRRQFSRLLNHVLGTLIYNCIFIKNFKNWTWLSDC